MVSCVIFRLDFRISEWISGFQIGFLLTVYEISLNATMYREAGARHGVYFNPECLHSVVTTVERGFVQFWS